MTKHTIKGYKENTFDEQVESDPIIEDLEVGLDALREELHLFANKKGSMVGPMVIVDSGDEIDLSRMGSGGWSVPSITEEYVIEFKKNEAEFVMLVEKEAVWHRLNEDKFWRKHKCLLLTCGGQATRGARRLIQRLSNELKLPVYVLVDNDPWGLYIYSVVKQGSISLAYESMRMACPKARYLGLRTRDFKTVQAFRRSEDRSFQRGHHARQADARLPVVCGQTMARRDQRPARVRLQDGDRSALQQGHQLRDGRVHSAEDRQKGLARLKKKGGARSQSSRSPDRTIGARRRTRCKAARFAGRNQPRPSLGRDGTSLCRARKPVLATDSCGRARTGAAHARRRPSGSRRSALRSPTSARA